MRRIQEKVKDLVEVRSYRSLPDFISDPTQTLAAYHFTDITAEMMSKWLDRVVSVQPQFGEAKALAGYRGVGKSHFLATLGAIVSHPELRSRITDSFVAGSAQRLKRRRYPVGYVRRGTHPTLFEEIKDAVAATFELDPSVLPETMSGVMNIASEAAGEVPFLLIIDTAAERVSRVSRDDGEPLGELAEIVKNLNVFVGVALDDDIAGADGVNAAIARSFTIDYLDQEHLHRIIEINLFPKYRHTQHLLHEIYNEFREVLPHFRWSEQRFTALYPLHPAILEIAPFVRLYDKKFVILDFASAAGNRVSGRPANSLIALDEVFDTVENSLRKSEDLQEAFETYDLINNRVISSIPIMQRLQAKLILKALLILSLNGEGTSAGEISSAMLIFSENDPGSTIKNVEETLETFCSAVPDRINRIVEDGREPRYGLRISGKDNLNNALAEKAVNVTSVVFEKLLRRSAKDRFSDWALQNEENADHIDSNDCQISWRGGLRRGRVIWNWERRGGIERLINSERNSEYLDWEVIVCHPESDILSVPKTEIPTVFWKPAPLKNEEEETLRRYYVLLTDNELRNDFGDQVRAAGHTHFLTVEKIWKRIFMDEGILLIDGFQHPFPEEAKHLQSLSELFSQMLMPLFELRFQFHPYFEQNLGMSEVSQLVSEHFSGTKQTFPEAQELARLFAVPLGLAIEQGENYILDVDEKLVQKTFAKEVMDLVEQSPTPTVTLKTIYQMLKREPFGLTREAQHIVLAALVAQRCLEFVTSKGDRINRRSLDLKIIWDDIVGVAKPSGNLYSSAALTKWAKTLTGVDTFQTIDNPSDVEIIIASLRVWLVDWKNAKLLERFEALPEEVLNTKIWKLARHAQNTFGMVEVTVESILARSISLEEGLQRVADAFSDSEEEFYFCAKNLVVLEDFISGLGLRKRIWEYLALCESTKDENIEELRHKLLYVLEEVTRQPSQMLNSELDRLWQAFFERYCDYFAIKHDLIMKSHLLQEKFDKIMVGDEWWEFENLSHLPLFHRHYWQEAQSLCSRFKELDCGFDVKEMLKSHPFCACSFSLMQIEEWEKLPESLSAVIEKGRRSYRKTLGILRETLIPLLEDFVSLAKEADFNNAAENLIGILSGKVEFRLLTNDELIILNKITQNMSSSPLLQVSLPNEAGFQTRSELQNQLNEWLIQLPSEPCLLKV